MFCGTIPALFLLALVAEFVTFVFVKPNDGELILFVVAVELGTTELTVLLTTVLAATLETLKKQLVIIIFNN